MTKHKKRIGKHDSVWHQSAEEATLAQKPYYNGFACGHGVHGDTKYNRSKQKRAWERQMKQEGAHYKGSFDFATCYRGFFDFKEKRTIRRLQAPTIRSRYFRLQPQLLNERTNYQL